VGFVAAAEARVPRGGLPSVSSPAAVIADHVDDLVQVRADDLPRWLTGLGVPAGWRLAALDGQGFRPSRTAARVPSSDGGGYGCDTVSLYRFTGAPATEIVVSQADCAVRDVHAENIFNSGVGDTIDSWCGSRLRERILVHRRTAGVGAVLHLCRRFVLTRAGDAHRAQPVHRFTMPHNVSR
jgi:hypothetical protein